MKTSTSSGLLTQAFNPETFQQQGHQLVDMLSTYFAQVQEGTGISPFKHYHPDELVDFWQKKLEQKPTEDLSTFFEEVIHQNIHTPHPQYMGHQVAATLPVNALADFLGAALNSGLGVYEMGSPIVAMERVVIKNLAKVLGYTEQADGVLTSGGTLGNLTALLTARHLKLPGDSWKEGTSASQKPALMVSEAAHYCVDRAAKVMGWGEEGIIKIPVDAQYCIRHDLLPQYLAEAKAQGKIVIAVVGNACSTSTGSYDNLEAIADFCETNDLWMHVDGAHGASVAFSDKYRPLIKGIERADSIVLDFHKMLLTSALTTALVYKNGNDAYRTFAQQASYLWADDQETEWHNLGKRTFECTKVAMSLRIFMIWQTYGSAIFGEHVTYLYDLGHLFGEILEESKDFEMPISPQSNIVCFRYVPDVSLSTEQLNQLNRHIRQSIIEEGDFYIVQTLLNGKVYLRVTLMSPFSTEKHLMALLEKVKKVANQTLNLPMDSQF
jgi:L-2,4-diaminobutyrate decarboxylase